MSSHSLEEERQAILDRMQRSRESYRRMLSGQGAISGSRHALHHDESSHSSAISHQPLAPANRHSYASTYRWAPRGGAMRILTDHPVMCALAVAAVVAIGPRRIVRTVANSGKTVTNLTLRNQANIAMLTRLLTTVADTMQRRNMRYP